MENETEQEMIIRESKKHADRLRRMLNIVKSTGFPSSKNANETMSVNGLIEFCGPDQNFSFNHYRLTLRAVRFLSTGVMD